MIVESLRGSKRKNEKQPSGGKAVFVQMNEESSTLRAGQMPTHEKDLCLAMLACAT